MTDNKELDELPKELLAQLAKRKKGEDAPTLVLNIIIDLGGIANLDQILIGVYRRTGKIWKRPNALAVVGTLKRKGLVIGKNGVYEIPRTKEKP